MRTHAPAGVRERVGVVDLADCLFEIVLPDRADVLGCVHVRRAGLVAHAALHATRCLDDRLLLVVAVHDLAEVINALFGLQFPHRLATRIDQVVFRGLVPAFAEVLVVHAPGVWQYEVAGEFIVGTGVHVFARQADRAGRTQVHTQCTPAATAVVDRRPQIAYALKLVFGQ